MFSTQEKRVSYDLKISLLEGKNIDDRKKPGTITGEITTEDLLDSIFSRFCIGK